MSSTEEAFIREEQELGSSNVKANRKKFAEKKKRALAHKISEGPRKAHLIEDGYLRPKK